MDNMAIFSESRASRIVYFLVSFFALIIFVPAAIGFRSIYPTDTWLLRALGAITESACLVVALFAGLLCIWTVTKAKWARNSFQMLSSKAWATMAVLVILVAVWFLTEYSE